MTALAVVSAAPGGELPEIHKGDAPIARPVPLPGQFAPNPRLFAAGAPKPGDVKPASGEDLSKTAPLEGEGDGLEKSETFWHSYGYYYPRYYHYYPTYYNYHYAPYYYW